MLSTHLVTCSAHLIMLSAHLIMLSALQLTWSCLQLTWSHVQLTWSFGSAVRWAVAVQARESWQPGDSTGVLQLLMPEACTHSRRKYRWVGQISHNAQKVQVGWSDFTQCTESTGGLVRFHTMHRKYRWRSSDFTQCTESTGGFVWLCTIHRKYRWGLDNTQKIQVGCV